MIKFKSYTEALKYKNQNSLIDPIGWSDLDSCWTLFSGSGNVFNIYELNKKQFKALMKYDLQKLNLTQLSIICNQSTIIRISKIDLKKIKEQISKKKTAATGFSEDSFAIYAQTDGQ